MKKAIIYLRYILPACFAVLTVVAAFIPSVAFTLEMNALKTRSVAAIMSDAWKQCRHYLSGASSMQGDATAAFSVWVTVGIIVTVLIAAAILIISVWAAVLSVHVIRLPSDDKSALEARRLLCRVFPSKVWLLVTNLLIIVPAAFPNYLAIIYTRVLYLSTEVKNGLMWIVIAFAVIEVALVLVSARYEKELGMDVFAIRTQGEE